MYSHWLCTMIFCDWYSSLFLSQEWYSLNWYSMLFYSEFDTPWGSDLVLLVIYTMSVNHAILMSSPSWVSTFDTSGSHCSFYPDSQLDFVYVHLVWFYCTCVCVPLWHVDYSTSVSAWEQHHQYCIHFSHPCNISIPFWSCWEPTCVLYSICIAVLSSSAFPWWRFFQVPLNWGGRP